MYFIFFFAVPENVSTISTTEIFGADNLSEHAELTKLQLELLQITDKICDIISHMTLADLMACFKDQCSAIQDLLCKRFAAFACALLKFHCDFLFYLNACR